MNTATEPLKTLILCTGNSARSILGEYLLRHFGRGRFEAYSAGARPTGRVHPLALRVLREEYGIDASEAYSKSCDTFRDLRFDCVITVCECARDACPVWLNARVVAHWGSPDPAAADGTDEERYRTFMAVAAEIACRMQRLVALPADALRDATIVGGIAGKSEAVNAD